MTEIIGTTALEALIKDAFRGVLLGNGVSVSQSVALGNYGRDSAGRELTRQGFAQLREKDLIDNWQRLRLTVDEIILLFFLDAEGFRYYIPACMTHALRGHAIKATMTLLSCGHWPKRVPEPWVALLTDQQKRAIAQFLYWLPYNLDLGDETRPINNLIERGCAATGDTI